MRRFLVLLATILGLGLMGLVGGLSVARQKPAENLIVLASDRGGLRGLYTLEPNSRWIRSLTRPYRGFGVWSVDEERLYFLASDHHSTAFDNVMLYSVEIAIREVNLLIQNVSWSQLASQSIEPGWIIFAQPEAGKLFRVPVEGGAVEEIVLPDGLRLLDDDSSSITRLRLGDNEGIFLTGRVGNEVGIYQISLDWKAARLILPLEDFDKNGESRPYVTSYEGWLLVSRHWVERGGEWYRMRPDGSELSRFPPGETREMSAITMRMPDQRILLMGRGYQYWAVYDIHATDAEPVWSAEVNSESFPTAAPDGSLIVYELPSEQGATLFGAKLDGSPAQALTQVPGGKEVWGWTPDGEWLTFGNFTGDGTIDIYRMRADGSDLQKIVENAATTWAWWTADGQWLMYMAQEAEGQVLYRVRADGSQLTRLTDPRFDEEFLAFMPMFTREWQPFGLGMGGFLGVAGALLIVGLKRRHSGRVVGKR